MKILLIMPPYLGLQQDDGYRWPLMGVLYLAANLERSGHEVFIEDFFFLDKGIPHYGFYYYGKKPDYIENVLTCGQYDLIAITCPYTSRWPFVKDLLKISKRLKPNVPTIVGGIYPSTSPKECLEECPSLDFVLVGEADSTIVDFCNSLEGKIPFSEVEGLAYRQNGGVHLVPKIHYIENLDELPFPAYHLLPMEKYFKVMRSLDLRGRLLPLLTSRSCPFRCPFCNMYICHGRKWRSRSPRNVVDEIIYLKQKYNVGSFAIIDDNLTTSKKRIKEICKLIIDNKLNIKWDCPNGVSVRTLDRETLSIMKDAGCTSLVLSIESGNEEIRNKVMRKGLSIEKIEEVVFACRDLGIFTNGGFIIGYPGDNEKTINDTLQLIKKYPFDFIGINILWPYKGTEVYGVCIKKGYLKIENQEVFFNIDTATPIIETEDFDKDKVLEWKSLIIGEFRRKQGKIKPLIKKLTSKRYRIKCGLSENLFAYVSDSLLKILTLTKGTNIVENRPQNKYPEGYDLSK